MEGHAARCDTAVPAGNSSHRFDDAGIAVVTQNGAADHRSTPDLFNRGERNDGANARARKTPPSSIELSHSWLQDAYIERRVSCLKILPPGRMIPVFGGRFSIRARLVFQKSGGSTSRPAIGCPRSLSSIELSHSWLQDVYIERRVSCIKILPPGRMIPVLAGDSQCARAWCSKSQAGALRDRQSDVLVLFQPIKPIRNRKPRSSQFRLPRNVVII